MPYKFIADFNCWSVDCQMKDLFKRFIPQFSTLLVICLIAGYGFIKKDFIDTKSKYIYRPTVIIDAGHGGFDGGAVASDGTVEKDINLSIAKKLGVLLNFSGFDIIMTRTDDTATNTIEGSIAKRKKSDLKNRLELMEKNKDAIYVSIHLNKFTTSSANGAQVFYTPNFKEASTLGGEIQSSITSLLQPDNTRVIKMGTSSTYILKNAKVPTVIVECGFLSNTNELKKLKDKKYQTQMSFAIAAGILNFYKE